MVSTRREHCWQKALLLRECFDGEGCLAQAMVPPWAVLHEMTADIGYLHPSCVRSPPLTPTSGTAGASFETSHSAQSHFFPPFRKGGSSELSLLNPHVLISISEASETQPTTFPCRAERPWVTSEIVLFRLMTGTSLSSDALHIQSGRSGA